MISYSDYQLFLLRWTTYVQVCTYYVDKDGKTQDLRIRRTGKGWVLIYYILWINTLVKVVYLFMTYQGWLLEVEFLDKMSIWVYFLMLMEMVQETIIWCRRHPLFEILKANWCLHKEIFRKVGEPERMQKEIKWNDRFLVYFHSVIVIIGCTSLMFQYYTAPKYALNTYAIVPFENDWVKALFAAHEFLFMWHAWVLAAGSIVLCEIFSVSYTHLIKEMAVVGASLQEKRVQIKTSLPEIQNVKSLSQVENKSLGKIDENDEEEFRYTIEELLKDYRKILLATNEFNTWAGYWMGGTVATLYVQFISDVFIMIQILNEPGSHFMEVFFFCQDAIVGMLIIFRMLILMSRVYPASTKFLYEIVNYHQRNAMLPQKRKYLVKYARTLRPVAAKLGGYTTTPTAVPTGVHTLINYYIAAALWKHPT